MSDYPIPAGVDRIQKAALLGAAFGLLLCVWGALASPTQLLRSYLFAYLFFVNLVIGCLSILMLHHLTGGLWGLVIRRILEAGTRTVPLAALLFLPVLIGLKGLYAWADPSQAGADKALTRILAHKAPYLNPPFFVARSLFYFAVWWLLAFLLSKWSLELDRGEDLKVARRLRGLSGGGLVLMGFTITFSSVDWAMSLDPRWYSTIYGILFMVGQALSCFAFAIALLAFFSSEKPFSDVVLPQSVHDLGKLLLAFVMLWTYMHLSQFLITWSGNLPEEISFYARRLEGGWKAVGLFLVLFHFALPFLLLLSRSLKRDARLLGAVAVMLFLVRIVELFWIVTPEFGGHGPSVHLTDLAALLFVGGSWLWFFAFQLKGRPLLPVGAPEIAVLLREASAP
jgi:hypothetical protein